MKDPKFKTWAECCQWAVDYAKGAEGDLLEQLRRVQIIQRVTGKHWHLMPATPTHPETSEVVR